MHPATKTSDIQATPHKWYRLPLSDDQTTEIRTAIHAYFQSAELSAKGRDIEETMVALRLLCGCRFFDGSLIATADGDVFLCKDGEDPYPFVFSRGHQDDPGPRGTDASEYGMET